MKITLLETEIKQALTDYISASGFDVQGKTVNIKLIAGRGPKGHSANLEIVPANAPAETVEAVADEGEAPEPQEEQAAIDFDFGKDD